MLQSWASYLLGASQESQGTLAERITEEAHLPKLKDLLREDIEDEHLDDDWVLISCNHVGNSSTDIGVSKDEGMRRVPSVHELLTRTSSSSSLHSHDINVEESWFLTPPPCFTSTGPSNMGISPFENLLIEHPSMSVYTHAPPRKCCLKEILSASPVRDSSPEPKLEEDDDLEAEEVDNEVAIVRRFIRRYRMQIQLQERQYSKYMHSKKVQIQKSNKFLKKAYVERNNKAREVNSRNHRQRRGERSQGVNRSRANNNRKC